MFSVLNEDTMDDFTGTLAPLSPTFWAMNAIAADSDSPLDLSLSTASPPLQRLCDTPVDNYRGCIYLLLRVIRPACKFLNSSIGTIRL